MTYSTEMMIEDKVIAMFREAIVNPDNLDASEPDGINWNFVDADVHIGVKEAELGELAFELDWFVEGLINEYLEFGEVDDNTADQ